MKKILVIIICLILFGCSQTKQEEKQDEVIEEEVIEEKETIAYDVAAFSNTTIYAFVSDVVNNYSEYEGEKIKIRGVFRAFHSDNLNKDYYVCMVEDSTACCSQGIEFILADGEYPDEGREIVLTGTVNRYQEGTGWYFYLSDASYIY